MSDDKPKGNHVLVKYTNVKTIYSISTAGAWKKWERRAGPATWEEVARGTYKEMEVLAKLMPEPKVLNFD
jgi:hypothetical protein